MPDVAVWLTFVTISPPPRWATLPLRRDVEAVTERIPEMKTYLNGT